MNRCKTPICGSARLDLEDVGRQGARNPRRQKFSGSATGRAGYPDFGQPDAVSSLEPQCRVSWCSGVILLDGGPTAHSFDPAQKLLAFPLMVQARSAFSPRTDLELPNIKSPSTVLQGKNLAQSRLPTLLDELRLQASAEERKHARTKKRSACSSSRGNAWTDHPGRNLCQYRRCL